MSIFRIGKRWALFIVCAVLLCALWPNASVSAAQLAPRSLTLGTPTAGANTSHTFAFTYGSTTTIGSIGFEYCDSPLVALACVAPTGLNVSGATLTSQTGETGFSIFSTTSNTIVLTRAAAATGLTASSYAFANAVNPTGAPITFYVRVSTYATTDATGSNTDFGAVVNATTQSIFISTEVPPILNFCVGQSIPGDCSTATGSLVDLGALSSSTAGLGTSQILVGTNAQFGMAIVAQGTTMTSGNNIIPALASPTASAPGNSQFGINLRANTDPPVGADATGAGVATPSPDYNITNQFTFRNNDAIATTPFTTDYRKFTVSYVVNVSPSQPAGIYTATLTYICTATF